MKKFVTALLALCMVLAMIPPAHALEYTFDETEEPSYGKPTSFEPVGFRSSTSNYPPN